MSTMYPICMNMKNRPILVVGGGTVARRKVETLLPLGAWVTVISPEICSELQLLSDQGKIILHKRCFKNTDVDKVSMVFITTNHSELNHNIASLCREKGILVNAADDPENCDFFVPSVIRRDSLVVAISTEGKCPAFAKWLREKLEEWITPNFGCFASFMGKKREEMKSNASQPQLSRSHMLGKMLYPGLWEDLQTEEIEMIRRKAEDHCI